MRFVSVGKTMTTLYLSFVASYLGLGFDFQKRGFFKKNLSAFIITKTNNNNNNKTYNNKNLSSHTVCKTFAPVLLLLLAFRKSKSTFD